MDTLSTIALTWRIERRDGVAAGLTSHERDLTIDGFAYRAAPGMTPSAIRRSADLDADTMDVSGALGGAAIGEADLLAGRWDGARVVVRAIDWISTEVIAELGEGRIGQVELRDGSFTAELAGIAALLDRPVCEATLPECRAELGDARCRVAMAGRRRFARVTASEDTLLTVDTDEPLANAYGNGLLRWIGGGNSGLESAIAASDGATLTLRSPPHVDPAGALVELIEGCDKSLATCAARFANAANFRGEPYLPGIDLLTRYPGA
ncbi:DUF2163 domain-containing protein [Sphingomonas bacterium]|uniref:DUF2163 domain-containing protein n=1 Tax=Sphingomonas bacterium TaxID=1895847 RepID=UPI00260C93CC|nr:DUF2163 domain-containing protein [Sphingomonas bacterium]MDB5677102.1 phage protein [Sphingomonas bacterium]